MRFRYFSVAILFVVLVAGLGYTARAQKTPGNLNQRADEILKMVNLHRKNKGLKPLVNNTIIEKAAEKHSKNMATKVIPFSHDGFDERMELLAWKLRQVNGWSENVAYSQKSAKDVVAMWLKSPGHKENIEGNYNLTGIGIARNSSGDIFYTQIFIRKE
jgi:uncharacterized protein YkwD